MAYWRIHLLEHDLNIQYRKVEMHQLVDILSHLEITCHDITEIEDDLLVI